MCSTATFVLLLSRCESSEAQWSYNGSNVYYNGGYVGIGTTTPGVRSEIANNGSPYNLYLSGFAPSLWFGAAQGVFPNGTAGQTGTGFIALATSNGAYGASQGDMILGTQSWTSANASAIRFMVPNNDSGSYAFAMSILRNGNVGIGTVDPQNKLSVNGTIQAKDVLVNIGWADYVFDPEYRLPELATVAAHIKAHRHLPGIPSAATVSANGVNLGEMQSRLLAKVEELTLYLIKADEKITHLQEQNQEMLRVLKKQDQRPVQ